MERKQSTATAVSGDQERYTETEVPDQERAVSNRLTGRVPGPDRLELSLVMQAVWMLMSLVLIVAFGMFSGELYFIIAFIGLLVANLLFEPADAVSKGWIRLQWIIWCGFLILGYVVSLRVQEILV